MRAKAALDRRRVELLSVCLLVAGGCATLPTASPVSPAPVALKKLSLRELMDVEVTAVSRVRTKLSETAASVHVITSDDIRRSGATTVMEALRLAPNLQVAQVNGHDWAITARGFNSVSVATGSIANKLLVRIDGRSVYTPLFGGVFWDAQHVFLEDIERIEVVSGPGGTLWGANAVNGVINIITRSAKETQGGTATLAAGSVQLGSVRYGGTIGRDFFWRVYGQHFDADSTIRGSANGRDDWNATQAGMRADYQLSEADHLIVQGDFYEGGQGTPSTAWVNGQNLKARWRHVTSPDSDWVVRLYFDRTKRTFPQASFEEELRTADLDFQHRWDFGGRSSVLWGVGYRHMWDDLDNGSFSFLPAKKTMRLFSGFVQDELTGAGGAWKVTIGTKFEHNDFSGLETQPSVRLAWTPQVGELSRQMAWAAASRAVRSPSRIDTEIRTGATVGNPAFEAENVIAYEIGYRVTPADSLSLSLAAFHNQYTDVRSVNQDSTRPGGLTFGNDLEATTSGIELSGAFQPAGWWRLRGGYTYLEKDFRILRPEVFEFSEAFETQDPRSQLLLHSVMDLPRRVQFDVVARHVAELPATLLGPVVPPYTTADVRLAWRSERWEIAAIARNLAGDHSEFNSGFVPFEIPRSYQGRLSFAW